MTYQSNFECVDDLIKHLDAYIGSIVDHNLRIQYIGLVAVVAIAAYESSIKEIFKSFATQTHPALCCYIFSDFDKINAKIKVEDLKRYITKFGDSYLEKFEKYLAVKNRRNERLYRRNFINSYAQILKHRHEFAHSVKITNCTYEEVKSYYYDGKKVIDGVYYAMAKI